MQISLHHKKTRGSALLSALAIMALIAIIATTIMVQLQMRIKQTLWGIQKDTMYLSLDAVTLWGMDTLLNPDFDGHHADNRGKVGVFPKRYQNITPNVITTGQMYDLQSRLNINNLVDDGYRPVFFYLFTQQSGTENPNLQLARMESIIDWLKPADPSRGKDNNIDYYLHQKPPMLPSHFNMQDISELNLVSGMNEKVLRAISPYITALPEVTKINIFTAPKAVIKAIQPDITPDGLEHFMEIRDTLSEPEYDIHPLIEKYHIPEGLITLESQYFLIIGSVIYQGKHLTQYSVLKRTIQADKRPVVMLVQQYYN